ncbi:MAG: chromate transporter [Alphaproteobacteria bacterium]|jgi:chromate transporter|nr:chromate transporter [Alphaproteobacteria bacterium]
MSPREFSEPGRKGEVVGSWREVLLAFLRLGLTSFGGPVAHIGYFRDEFVVRRHWLEDHVAGAAMARRHILHGPAELRSTLSDALRG